MQYTCYRREPKWLLVAAILLLSACSSAPRQQPAPVSESGYPVPPAPPSTEADQQDNGGWRLHEPVKPEDKPAVTPPSSAGAVGALLGQAEREYQRGNYERAIAAAERALRIDRRNGDIYLLLAKSYWQQALPAQSEQFARQGLRYSQTVQLTDALNKVLNEVAGRR